MCMYNKAMIRQDIVFSASPWVVYDILMDEKKHSALTGAKAKIENKVGGTFSVWDGYAQGKNTELIKGRRIKQLWRASDWPRDAVSELTIVLDEKDGETILSLTQKGVPEGFEKDIEKGWNDYYWKPLKEYLENNY